MKVLLVVLALISVSGCGMFGGGTKPDPTASPTPVACIAAGQPGYPADYPASGVYCNGAHHSACSMCH